jgi:hypothetical protein
MKRAAYRPRLVIMAKLPQIGRVKTRLARDIGPAGAVLFYRSTLEAAVRRLRDDRRWELTIAVAPDPSLASPVWPVGARLMAQGPGDLGARMGRVFEVMPHGPVAIIGSDIPAITKDDIAAAFHALSGHDAAIGPAPDGGYWLIGMRRSRASRDPFSNVRWSTPHARDDTLTGLAGRSVAFLRQLADVDSGDEHRAWRRGEL